MLSLEISHPYQLMVKHSCTTHCNVICFGCHSEFYILDSWWSNIHLLNIVRLSVSDVTRNFTSGPADAQRTIYETLQIYLFMLSLAISHPDLLMFKHSFTKHCNFIFFCSGSQFYNRISWWSDIHLLNIVSLSVSVATNNFTCGPANFQTFIY